MPNRYQELEIELSRCCHCEEPEIRVLASSYNRPREPFTLSDEDRRAVVAKVAKFEDSLLRPDVDAVERKRLSEEIGRDLYELLLPGSIGRAFTRSYDALRGNEGLRIRLSFGTPYDHTLGGLPWELLHNNKGQFLANDSRTPVARFLDLDERIVPLPVGNRLRVLGVIACPDDKDSAFSYSKIDPEPHRAVIAGAMRSTRYLHVSFLHDRGPVTSSALREYLLDAEAHGKPFHAIHFLGHGGFDDAGEGVLFFERGGGGDHLVTGRELAELLPPSVKLVVLASCDTAKIPTMRQGSQHAFMGVASALLHKGIPAVVAMQFAVSEQAAASFAQAFYRMIDRNRPIDEAVTEGRLRIKTEGEKDALEWATPVLFLRARDGKVLDLQTKEVPPKTVSIFNVLDHGQDQMDHVDFSVDLRDCFDGRFLREDASWNETIVDRIRHTLREQLPAGSPCQLKLAAPISVAFAAGFFLPIKKWGAVSVVQSGDLWRLEGAPPSHAPTWLTADAAAMRMESREPDFPLSSESDDIAVVVETSRPMLEAVADFLRRPDLHPPRVGHLLYVCVDQPDHFGIKSGAHARELAEGLINRIDTFARRFTYPTVHFFIPGPNGFAFALGRLCHVLPRIQLYEFDFEKTRHKSYEASITLTPKSMDRT